MIIDVSANNGIIDWAAVKKHSDTLPQDQQIKLVMIKANEGYLYADKQAVYNAKQSSKFFDVGYYHFATLNTLKVIEDAEQEANYFLKSLNDMPEAKGPLALDIETNQAKLTAPQVVLWAKTFFNVLKEAGKTNLALYSGLSFLNSNHFNLQDFPDIKLWVAEYTKGSFTLPAGFPNAWAWQFTCEGQFDGIKGNVDMSKLKI